MDYKTFVSPGGTLTNGTIYIGDPNLVVAGTTGVFRPAMTSDFAANINVSGLNVSVGAVAVTGTAAVNVVNSAPLAISGVVQTVVTGAVSANFDSTSIVLAQGSGNVLAQTANQLLSGVSGQLAASATRATWTTGTILIGNQGPIAVSGAFQANVTTSNTDVVGALTTGNAFLAGISGQLATNIDAPVVINSGTYTPSLYIITGSQMQIPAGVRSASVTVVSGSAFVNAVGPFMAGFSMGFGGYDGRFLMSTAVNVGCTGSAATPCQTVVMWES